MKITIMNTFVLNITIENTFNRKIASHIMQ